MGRARRHRTLRRLIAEIRSMHPRVQILVARGVPPREAQRRVFGRGEGE